MGEWTAFPRPDLFRHDAASVAREWPRLHAGDAEPLPSDPAVLAAWVHFHNGDFLRATESGLAAGGDGITAANKATCMYANYLEQREGQRLALFLEAAQRAERQARDEPANPNAWHWHAYALGRYSQAISVAKALAQGLGSKVKESLERTIFLQPRHAEAHAALGAFHAEVIDKVGTLIGGMTFGVKRETCLRLFRDALRLHPRSPVVLVEYANGLVMLDGEKKMKEATRLYREAMAITPLDAKEWLDVQVARVELGLGRESLRPLASADYTARLGSPQESRPMDSLNIFQALLVSHQEQRALYARLLATKPASQERQHVFEELKAELAAHETAEERCFYVPLIEHDESVDLSRHGIAEHHVMDEMIEHLEQVDPHAAEWQECCQKLCDKIEHHLNEEEQKFFPKAGEILDDAQKIQLGRDYEAEFMTLRIKQEA
jgi:tetratricopeptide (TPR) repeat protein